MVVYMCLYNIFHFYIVFRGFVSDMYRTTADTPLFKFVSIPTHNSVLTYFNWHHVWHDNIIKPPVENNGKVTRVHNLHREHTPMSRDTPVKRKVI